MPRYSIRNDGKGLKVVVTDHLGNEVASRPAKDMDEALDLRDTAAVHGYEAWDADKDDKPKRGRPKKED